MWPTLSDFDSPINAGTNDSKGPTPVAANIVAFFLNGFGFCLIAKKDRFVASESFFVRDVVSGKLVIAGCEIARVIPRASFLVRQ